MLAARLRCDKSGSRVSTWPRVEVTAQMMCTDAGFHPDQAFTSTTGRRGKP